MSSSFYIDPAVQAQLHPVALEPIPAERPWGVEAHASWNFPSKADSVKWGEIWLAAEDFGLATKVASGPHKGRDPAWLLAKWGRGLVGYRERLEGPALTASIRIERTGAAPGPVRAMDKEELWYVLEAGAESFLAFSGDGQWPKCQKRLACESGDSLAIPAGLAACQGPRLTILKALPAGAMVQTIYNWDRPPDLWDFTAPPREVPLLGGEPRPLSPVAERRERLIHQNDLYELKLVKTAFATGRGDGLSIICPVKGRGRLQSAGNPENLRLHPGQAYLVPAAQSRWSIESGTLVAYLHFRLY